MNSFVCSIGAAAIAVTFQTRADPIGSASCGAMTTTDQCRISWKFSRTSNAFNFLQQFDPLRAEWHNIADLPADALFVGTHDNYVEAGYLYRVLACDDAKATANCSGSTMVWAPFVQPQNQVHLIPSRIPLVGSEDPYGNPIFGVISKNLGWLSQVIQYNVIQMTNAIARAKVSELPDMTPVKDIRIDPPDDPIEQVQFNVYWFYSAARGVPLDEPPPVEFTRPPHDHPERHPQEMPQQ